MAQPSSRDGLIDYAKRQLGFPVLEINVADEQFSDLLDDAVQVFHERHYDGMVRMYLKYKVTQDDIDRGQARGGNSTLGITTTTTTSTVGLSTTFDLEENNNYIQMPPSVIGVNNKVIINIYLRPISINIKSILTNIESISHIWIQQESNIFKFSLNH